MTDRPDLAAEAARAHGEFADASVKDNLGVIILRALERVDAAAEQRGREEEREKLAKRYDDEADRLEQASVDTLSVADKIRLDASASQCRELAADIRRGDGTAPPSSPPEQNGESATPSHAPTPEGKG